MKEFKKTPSVVNSDPTVPQTQTGESLLAVICYISMAIRFVFTFFGFIGEFVPRHVNGD